MNTNFRPGDKVFNINNPLDSSDHHILSDFDPKKNRLYSEDDQWTAHGSQYAVCESFRVSKILRVYDSD
jgi:hypothetical protein